MRIGGLPRGAGCCGLSVGQVTGEAQAQAQAINGSLTTLGRVVKMLGEKSREHIPYRWSGSGGRGGVVGAVIGCGMGQGLGVDDAASAVSGRRGGDR